tara:strand:+ start:1590 stop:2351 length:762 start_codon:yes stop_codon:yes gene_type:complete
MPDYDILWGTGEGDDFTAYTGWDQLFADTGFQSLMGDNTFEGEIGSQDMYDYLAANPHLQFGYSAEDWNADDFEGINVATDQPAYWLYEDVEGDDVYADLEDILHEIYGSGMEQGQSVYDEIFDDLGYGDPDLIYGQYLDEFFNFNPETGEFESAYDAQEFEQTERNKFKLGTDKITRDLETSMGKMRASGVGRGLGDIGLDIGDIAGMVEGDISGLAEDYRTGVYESESAYLDDLMESIAQMSGESTAFLDD